MHTFFNIITSIITCNILIYRVLASYTHTSSAAAARKRSTLIVAVLTGVDVRPPPR